MHQHKCLISVPNVCLGPRGPSTLTQGGLAKENVLASFRGLMPWYPGLGVSSLSVFHSQLELSQGERRFVLSPRGASS